jgi:hypothetical protein
MSAYVQDLNRAVAMERAQHEEKKRADIEAKCERFVPLVERLRRVLSKVPLETQAEGISMASLEASLKGRS